MPGTGTGVDDELPAERRTENAEVIGIDIRRHWRRRRGCSSWVDLTTC